jgi:hypothetical protein
MSYAYILQNSVHFRFSCAVVHWLGYEEVSIRFHMYGLDITGLQK